MVVGQTYLLTWAYGDRPGSGPQETNVLFGGNLVTTDVDAFAGSNLSLVWTLNSFLVTANATTETLSFQAVDTSGSGGSGAIELLWRRQAV